MARTPISVNDVLEVILKMTMPDAGSEYMLNTFHYRCTNVGPTVDGYAELAAAFRDHVVDDPYMLVTVDNLKFVEIIIRRVIPAQVEAPFVLPIALEGTRAGIEPLPTNVAAVLRRNTLQKGPRGNGRIFVPGLSVDDVNLNLWQPAAITLLQGLATTLNDGIAASGFAFEPVILNKTGTPPIITGSAPVFEVAVNAGISGMITRRRYRGR